MQCIYYYSFFNVSGQNKEFLENITFVVFKTSGSVSNFFFFFGNIIDHIHTLLELKTSDLYFLKDKTLTFLGGIVHLKVAFIALHIIWIFV